MFIFCVTVQVRTFPLTLLLLLFAVQLVTKFPLSAYSARYLQSAVVVTVKVCVEPFVIVAFFADAVSTPVFSTLNDTVAAFVIGVVLDAPPLKTSFRLPAVLIACMTYHVRILSAPNVLLPEAAQLFTRVFPSSAYSIRYFTSEDVFTVKPCTDDLVIAAYFALALTIFFSTTANFTVFPRALGVSDWPAFGVILLHAFSVSSLFPTDPMARSTVQVRVSPDRVLLPAAVQVFTRFPPSA